MVGNINNLQDILIKMIDPARGAFKTGADSDKAIARLLARVTDVKGERALLRWAGGNFSARLEVPVYKGEHLLLEHYTQRGEKMCYRILARTQTLAEARNPAPGSTAAADSLLWSFLIPYSGDNYPVLIRYYPPPEKGKSKSTQKRTLLELVIETKNLGLVMIRLRIKKDGYECVFLVESQKTGELLENEVREIIQKEGRQVTPGKEILSWAVFPVRKEIARGLTAGKVLIDAQV